MDFSQFSSTAADLLAKTKEAASDAASGISNASEQISARVTTATEQVDLSSTFQKAKFWEDAPPLDVEANKKEEDDKKEAEPPVESCCSLSRSERFKGFVGLMIGSAVFFSMSLSFLPLAVLRPGKFAVPFTLGSVCFMGSFAMLRGPWTWVSSVFSRERLPFTASYFGSMFFTLYACLGLRSYILTAVMSCVQFLALAWYGVSYIPGGQRGMKVFTWMFLKTAKNIIAPLGAQCAKCCARCSERALLPR